MLTDGVEFNIRNRMVLIVKPSIKARDKIVPFMTVGV